MKNKQNWYRFKNLDDGKVEIFIYDVIVDYKWDEDETTAKGFIDDLKEVGSKTPIDLHINSPGGSVFAGLAIYNAIKRHQGNVIVYIDGLAASIASVVAMAGDTVIMPENALLMIHDPYTFAMGSAEELRKAAESLDKAKSGLISAYRHKTDLADDEISELMSAETWMTAEEAINQGFADQYEEALPMAALSGMAAFDLSRYHNIPQGIVNKIKTRQPDVDPEPQPSIKGEKIMNIEELKEKSPEVYDAVYDAGKKAGLEEGIQAGIVQEQARIASVEAQLVPGHEKLIAALKADGTTTGEQAAVKILAAEKELRAKRLEDLAADALDPVDPVNPGDNGDQEEQAVVAAMAAGLNGKRK